MRQLGAGLFAGVDEAICCALGLKEKKQLRQRKTWREVTPIRLALIEETGTDFKLTALGRRRLEMRGTAPPKVD
jgi:hypothetical protein